jgi:hypothetical protein
MNDQNKSDVTQRVIDKKTVVAERIADFFMRFGRNKYIPLPADFERDVFCFRYAHAVQQDETHFLPRYELLANGVSYSIRACQPSNSVAGGNHLMSVIFVENTDSPLLMRPKLVYMRENQDHLHIVVVI